MIAADGPRCLPARISWPLHAALKELHRDAGRKGLLTELSVMIEFEPAPEAGLRARGADAAVSALCSEGVLRRAGMAADAILEVDPDLLVPYKRMLMSLNPETVRLLQRAGSRWDALCSTLLKNPATPGWSSASTVASLTASRHLAVPGFR